jgi:hypothetical protein
MGLLDDLSQVVRKQLAADVTALAVGIDLAELLSQEVMRGYAGNTRMRSERTPGADTPLITGR